MSSATPDDSCLVLALHRPNVCSEFEDMGYRYSARRPGTLVQALEITTDGSFVAAADTKRIDSGACGAL